MIEYSLDISGFSQGDLDTSNGKETETSHRLRTDFCEIPRGLQTFSVTPYVHRKQWNNNEQTYKYQEYTGTGLICYAWFYTETQAFIERVNAYRVTVSFLRHLGAKYVRFTVGFVATDIYPDDSHDTKSSYYFLDKFLINCTAVEWNYNENSELVHNDLKIAPEKAVSKPYPKALWRTDTGIPYHELLPVEKPAGAFMNATKLEYVRIPLSVRKIGKYAFANTVLRKVRIPVDCEYSETSFPENCIKEFYTEYGDEAISGQTYDCNGYILIDADGARIYTEGLKNG